MVRKYSSKRREVIAIATENPAGVLADKINGKLSGILRKAVDGREEKSQMIGFELERNTTDEELEGNDFDILNLREEITPVSQPESAPETEESDDSPEDKSDSLTESEHVEKSEEESDELDSSLQNKSTKPTRRNKWKPEEIKKLITLHGELNSRFQFLKGRMALWEERSSTLFSDGISRNPGQCKSLLASLVQKYEVCYTLGESSLEAKASAK